MAAAPSKSSLLHAPTPVASPEWRFSSASGPSISNRSCPETPDTATFPAHLDIVEPTGAESICYLQTGANTLICRSRHIIDTREAGHRMLFRADASKLLLFDPVNDQRID